MRCPNCDSSDVEREDHYDPLGSMLLHTDRLVPSADYECQDCGWAAHWEMGVGLTVTHDPREGCEAVLIGRQPWEL